MARKGQKFNKYSYELKTEIVSKYFNGEEGYTSLSKKYGIPVKTIENWIYQYKHKNNDLKGKKRGRKKGAELTQEDYKERYEILKKYQAFLKAQREKK